MPLCATCLRENPNAKKCNPSSRKCTRNTFPQPAVLQKQPLATATGADVLTAAQGIMPPRLLQQMLYASERESLNSAGSMDPSGAFPAVGPRNNNDDGPLKDESASIDPRLLGVKGEARESSPQGVRSGEEYIPSGTGSSGDTPSLYGNPPAPPEVVLRAQNQGGDATAPTGNVSRSRHSMATRSSRGKQQGGQGR